MATTETPTQSHWQCGLNELEAMSPDELLIEFVRTQDRVEEAVQEMGVLIAGSTPPARRFNRSARRSVTPSTARDVQKRCAAIPTVPQGDTPTRQRTGARRNSRYRHTRAAICPRTGPLAVWPSISWLAFGRLQTTLRSNSPYGCSYPARAGSSSGRRPSAGHSQCSWACGSRIQPRRHGHDRRSACNGRGIRASIAVA